MPPIKRSSPKRARAATPSGPIIVLFVLILSAVVGLLLARSKPPATPAVSTSKPTSAPVAIQDGQTIDFSSGRPVVKDSAAEKALIASSVQEMDAAARGVSFGPSAKTPTPSPAR